MNDYFNDLKTKALTNTNFREVLETGLKMQVVVMSLKPGEDIGAEVHHDNEQVLICMAGIGKTIVDGNQNEFKDGDMMLVRAGLEHNFINTGDIEMKIITIYSPPHHEDGIVHATKADATADEGDV